MLVEFVQFDESPGIGKYPVGHVPGTADILLRAKVYFHTIMLFDKPNRLADGRYFIKVTNDVGGRVFQQVNGAKLNDANVIVSNRNVFDEIDQDIVTQAKESKVAWFGKEISDETVAAAYQKSVNPEGELSASFATIKGNVITVFFDADKNVIDMPESFPTPVDVLVELVGLVFTKRAFEPVWKVIQVRLKNSKPKFSREYMFTDDSPEEDSMDL